MPTFLNPPDVHTPGAYSHTVSVPAGTELVFLSGQVGARVDGSVPSDFAEQAEQVFLNLHRCLAAHGLGPESVVKLTSYLVSGQDVQLMRAARQRLFGSHRPTSTAVFVPQLVSPEFLLEVEAVAVKALPAAAAGAA